MQGGAGGRVISECWMDTPVHTNIASEAVCGKVSFDVPASRLALWWQVEKGRCSLESTRGKSSWQVPNPGSTFLF